MKYAKALNENSTLHVEWIFLVAWWYVPPPSLLQLVRKTPCAVLLSLLRTQ